MPPETTLLVAGKHVEKNVAKPWDHGNGKGFVHIEVYLFSLG
jgi:hypothetical protein